MSDVTLLDPILIRLGLLIKSSFLSSLVELLYAEQLKYVPNERVSGRERTSDEVLAVDDALLRLQMFFQQCEKRKYNATSLGYLMSNFAYFLELFNDLDIVVERCLKEKASPEAGEYFRGHLALSREKIKYLEKLVLGLTPTHLVLQRHAIMLYRGGNLSLTAKAHKARSTSLLILRDEYFAAPRATLVVDYLRLVSQIALKGPVPVGEDKLEKLTRQYLEELESCAVELEVANLLEQ